MVVRLTKLAEKQYKRLNNPLLSRVQEPPEAVIEPASPKEIEMIEKGVAKYRADPSSCRLWDDIRKEHPVQ